MEAKKLTIEIPQGKEIDWQESAKQEKIVFKRKENTKPRSWEEYCMSHKQVGYYVDINGDIAEIHHDYSMSSSTDKNLLPSKELAEAFLAMMQLMSLRQDWIGDWKPDWSIYTKKYVIQFNKNRLCVDVWQTMSCPLSFPTQEMAEDFMNCFKDLLEIAKPLI